MVNAITDDHANADQSEFATVVTINGTTVTEKNKDEFFEIEYDKVKALSFLENRSQ
jgi:hypothetical protein